jgi:hypothetical protein
MRTALTTIFRHPRESACEKTLRYSLPELSLAKRSGRVLRDATRDQEQVIDILLIRTWKTGDNRTAKADTAPAELWSLSFRRQGSSGFAP